jgi:gamma-glutamylcyclotransferase (GGCT)/AIG2-like uncharacterized protein YtfP
MIKYFSYGSNMSEHRMKVERKINFISRKFAILENYKLIFNKVSKNNIYIGYANIIESKGDFVEGVLYEISDSDLKIINKFEGFPIHYYKTDIEVICDDQKICAVVYIANPTMIRENIKPDKKYLNYLLEAKDILSEKYYNNLLLTKTID